jgi:putative sterol carrier protein
MTEQRHTFITNVTNNDPAPLCLEDDPCEACLRYEELQSKVTDEMLDAFELTLLQASYARLQEIIDGVDVEELNESRREDIRDALLPILDAVCPKES